MHVQSVAGSFIIKITLVKMLCQAIIVAAISVSFVKASPMEDLRSAMIEIAMECQKTNPITDEEAALLHKHVVPDSIAVHCFMACVLKTPGIIGDDTMVDHDVIVGMITELFASDPDLLAKAIKLSEYCAKEANSATISTDDKACGRATVAFVCLRDNSEKFGIAIIE